MESTGQVLRHLLVTSVFPVVPLLFRNMMVVHAPHDSSDWRCQTSLFLGGVTSLVYLCPMLLLLTERNMYNYPPSRIKGQFGQPPGGEDELLGFISVFCKPILVNTDRISRRLYVEDSNAVYRDLSWMEMNHVRC